MPKSSPDPLAPKVYLPSESHPDYEEEAWKYALLQELNRGQTHLGAGLFTARDHARFYSDDLEKAKVYSDEKDKYVIKAVKLFGDHLVELTVSLNPIRFSEEAERLAVAVLRVLGNLRSQTLRGRYEERKKAKARLEKIVKGITPDTRGKKRNTVDPREIRWFYWRQMFRLYHVQHALKSSQRNIHLKVQTASKNYGLSVELIREFWGLDENDNPYRQPLATLKEMARELTARHFKLTLPRVSNVLASR